MQILVARKNICVCVCVLISILYVNVRNALIKKYLKKNMTEKHKLESCDQLKGNNWSAENFIKHVTSMTWHMNPRSFM